MSNNCGCPPMFCAPMGNATPPTLTSYQLESIKGALVLSTSHVFRVPEQTGTTNVAPLVLSLISLLQQSRAGNLGVHSVDIDVRKSEVGIELKRGNGVDLLYEGGSRSWHGADNGLGVLSSATDFTLTLKAGDEVVINWTEIR